MTTPSTSPRTSATGTGAAQTVPFTFPIVNNSDITVTQRITATGVESTLTETTHYTVTNSGSSGGSITTVTPFVAATAQIHIVRNTADTQTLDLEQGGSFNAENIEAALDKNTRLIQEKEDSISRTAKFPAADPTSSIGDLPSSIDRISLQAGYDSTGKPNAISAVPAGSVAFTTIGENIAEAADAETVTEIIGTNNFVNVKNSTYGATGDGATDDGAAVKAAIDAADDGDTVWFPKGTYICTTWTAVTLTKDITIAGAGRENVTITGPDTSTDFIDMGASGNLVMRDVGFSTWDKVVLGGTDAISYIDIENCKADGCDNLYSDVGGATAGTVTSFRIDNCKLSNMTNVEIAFRTRTNTFCSVTNCEFTDSSGGGGGCIWIGDDDDAMANEGVIISGNSFRDIDSSGTTWCVLVYGFGAVITDNTFNTITGTTNAYSIYTKASSSIISDNVIIDGTDQASSSGSAIKLAGANRDDGAPTTPFDYDNVITNNTITFTTPLTYWGIVGVTSSTDYVINNNAIDGANTAILITETSGKINVSHNNIHNCSIGISMFGAGTDWVIESNVMHNLSTSTDNCYGIRLRASTGDMSNVIIVNNIFDTLVDTNASVATAIRLFNSNAVTDVLISGNIVETADYGIWIASTTGGVSDIQILDNVFRTIGALPIRYNSADLTANSGFEFISRNNKGFDLTHPDIISYENDTIFYENEIVKG